jgi:hypothetical protein
MTRHSGQKVELQMCYLTESYKDREGIAYKPQMHETKRYGQDASHHKN